MQLWRVGGADLRRDDRPKPNWLDPHLTVGHDPRGIGGCPCSLGASFNGT